MDDGALGIPTPRGGSAGTHPVEAILRADVLREGITDDVLRAHRLRGTLQSLRPGIYLADASWQLMTPEQRHRSFVRAFAGSLAEGTVVSHLSAAVVHGLPLWRVPLRQVHVSRKRDGGTHRTRHLHVHRVRCELPRELVDGVVVTPLARTVVDCARTLPFEQGVVIADAALNTEDVTREDLLAEVRRARGRVGVAKAAAVAEFCDGRSESVGESRSRVAFSRLGLPPMHLQHEIADETGRFVACVDFALPELKIAGEFDGKVKYQRLVPAGLTPGDVVFDEKNREDAIRRLGWGMVRWIWSDLERPHLMAERWRRELRARQNVRLRA